MPTFPIAINCCTSGATLHADVLKLLPLCCFMRTKPTSKEITKSWFRHWRGNLLFDVSSPDGLHRKSDRWKIKLCSSISLNPTLSPDCALIVSPRFSLVIVTSGRNVADNARSLDGCATRSLPFLILCCRRMVFKWNLPLRCNYNSGGIMKSNITMSVILFACNLAHPG